jgi:hypothetical protein
VTDNDASLMNQGIKRFACAISSDGGILAIVTKTVTRKRRVAVEFVEGRARQVAICGG